MAVFSNCPTEKELRRLAEGDMPLSELEALSQHLESCGHCLETMRALDSSNSSLHVRYSAPSDLPLIEDAVLTPLIERMKKLNEPTSDARRHRASSERPGHFSGYRLEDEPVFTAKYEQCEEIGHGGMGIVYRALHKVLGMKVAIKVSGPNADSARFMREARLLASVNSPFVVAVKDFEMLSNGHAMIVMDWIDADLQKLINARDGVVPEDEILPLMLNACEGMLAAEKKGIIHRDLKPSNLLIDSHGRVLVADFGLARGQAIGDDLSHSGLVMGTPCYMAPEQAEDCHNVDIRADVYSFGATFYHALTGKPPYEGQTLVSIRLKQEKAKPISPRIIRPNLSEQICNVIERCLAKSPADRFASFAEILKQLQPPTNPLVPSARVVLPDPGDLRKWERELGKVLYLNVTARTEGMVYGTDIYSSDSNVAKAAVHAGVLVPGENGVVCVRIVASIENFDGVTRHDVTSRSWNRSWHGAYHFVLPDPGDVSKWEKQVGRVLFFDVKARTDGRVYGTDIYSSDSAVAAAAIHAGALEAGGFGVVRVRVVPVPERYHGSTRNGITSRSWSDSWRGAYQIERA